MTAGRVDKVREWLGWCPGCPAVTMQRRSSAGTDPGPASLTAEGTRPAGSPISGSRDPRYEHTQPGYLLLATVGGACLLILVTILFLGPDPVPLIVLGILVFVLAIMTRLTVSVSVESLRIRFGPVGLVRKEWQIGEIVSAMVVTNPWYYGWGIHWTPNGALYNVSGRDAVEILFISGKKVRIGTDEPEALAGAINREIR